MAQVAGMNLNANLVDVIVQPTSAGARVNFSLDPATDMYRSLNRCLTGSSNAIDVARQVGTNAITLKGQTPGRGGPRVSSDDSRPAAVRRAVLAETLAAGGVKVTGQVRRDRTARQERIKAGDGRGGRVGGRLASTRRRSPRSWAAPIRTA